MEALEKLNYYKLTCSFTATIYSEKGIIASELDYKTINKRLKNSAKISAFELTQIKKDEVEFPVTLIGINQKYHSWEDLAKDYMISKIAGI